MSATAVLTCNDCGTVASFPITTDGWYMQITGPVYSNPGQWVVNLADSVILCPQHNPFE